MAMHDQDRQTLEALRAAREAHPDLAELLNFYSNLYALLFEAKAELPAREWPAEPASAMRMEAGLPQVTFEGLGLERDTFAVLTRRVAAVLQRHNPGWEEERSPTDDELLALAREVFDTWPTLVPPADDAGLRPEARAGSPASSLMAQAAAFALAASLQRAREEILPHLNPSLWQREFCPVCGGSPNLALLAGKTGARRLLCSRCDGVWDYSRTGCPFCRSKNAQTYYQSQDQVYRLYVCPDCNRYFKTVDLRELQRAVSPVVERLLTIRMDLAAQEAGFKG